MQQETHIENIRALHSALVTKRATLDQLIWQAPVIALITQAFLMTIAFDTTNSVFYRCLSGSVVQPRPRDRQVGAHDQFRLLACSR